MFGKFSDVKYERPDLEAVKAGIAKYMEDCEDDERFDYEKPDMEHNNIKKRIYEYSALFSIIFSIFSASFTSPILITNSSN